MIASKDASTILESEQLFFDREAESLGDRELLIAPDQMQRYREARLRPSNTPKDTLFSLLQPLGGKRVLEYGCGTGENACHLADCGAQVTAFDLSHVSVEKARRRASLLGLDDRISFDVKEAGQTGYNSASFDAVVGFAILHHLHMDLPAIYREVDRLLTRSGTAYFIEPVANNSMLRRLRRVVPVRCHATPDERQLVYADLELMKQHGFSRVDYVHFYCFERLHRLLGDRCSRPMRVLDHFAQSAIPYLQRCYGILLVIAQR